jgi:hypothetical protein
MGYRPCRNKPYRASYLYLEGPRTRLTSYRPHAIGGEGTGAQEEYQRETTDQKHSFGTVHCAGRWVRQLPSIYREILLKFGNRQAQIVHVIDLRKKGWEWGPAVESQSRHGEILFMAVQTASYEFTISADHTCNLG